MKFWKRLRWIATAAFLALIALGWLGSERTTAALPGSKGSPRAVRDFHH